MGRKKSSLRKQPAGRQTTLLRSRNAQLVAWGERHKARGVPIPLLWAAHQAALVSGELQAAIELANGLQVLDLGPAPPPEIWEQLYRRGDRLFERLGNSIFPALRTSDETDPGPGLGTFSRQVAFAARVVRRPTPDLIRQALTELKTDPEWQRQIALLREALQEEWERHLEELRRDDHQMIPPDSAMQSPEMQFFFRVWWVCWALYGESANTLFMRAAHGDVNAFEKLVRADDRFLQIPRIAEQWERWRLAGNQDARRIIGDALSGTTLQTTAKAQKLKSIALIFTLSRSLSGENQFPGATLRLEHLRELFDAAACDRGKLRDEDLPESDQAFRKAVQRAQAEQSSDVWDIF